MQVGQDQQVINYEWLYNHGGNASEAVYKISTDQNAQMLLVCCKLLNNQNIHINQQQCKKLVTRARPTYLRSCRSCTQKRAIKWLMVGFIYSGSEITTCMEYCFKTKSTKSKATFWRQEHFFLNFKLQITRSAQGNWST